MLLTDKGKLLLNFFCQRVEEVIAISATIEAKIPITGKVFPISNPSTKHAPIKPRITPIHCFHVTSSFKKGPASIAVNIGCKETIIAVVPTDKFSDIA